MRRKWTEEDTKNGWKPGWYATIIKNYIKVFDVIEIEYVSEPGKVLKVKVKKNVENRTLRLHVATCGASDLYDQVCEIGASIFVKWTMEEVQRSGWKAGWGRNPLFAHTRLVRIRSSMGGRIKNETSLWSASCSV